MIALASYWLAGALLLEVAARAFRRLAPRERLALLALPLLVVGPALLRNRTLAPIDQYGYFTLAGGAGEVSGDARPKYLEFDVFAKFLPWRAAAQRALSEGSLPIWNPGMNCGDPLLGASEPALAHPFVLASLVLPLTAGFDFVAAMTLLLAAASGYLLFRSITRRRMPALLGALAWMASDFLVLWLPYPVALSVASFPLTALCLARLARRRRRGDLARAAAAIALQLLGGHPESALYCFAGATIFALAILRGPGLRRAAPFVVRLASAALLGAALAAVALLPTLDTVRQSAEHEFRRAVYADQERSVGWAGAARRWAPNVVPYLYGRKGGEERADRPEFQPPASSYVGSAALIAAAIGLFSRRRRLALRLTALGLILAGTLVAAKAPGLADLLAKLPLFDVSIPEYNLVWGPFGLALLAALGADALRRRDRFQVAVSLLSVAALGVAAGTAWPGMRAAGLSGGFVRHATLLFLVPAALAGLVLTARVSARRGAIALLGLLAAQRLLEAAPTLAALAPERLDAYASELGAFPAAAEPFRVAATGERMIPNSATLAALEDPRGYTALTLRAYAETFPLWSPGGYPLANRIEDVSTPFLAMLNVKYVAVGPDDPVPAGWTLRSDLAPARILESSRALPRAYVPERVTLCSDRGELLQRLARERDFGGMAYLESGLEGAAECVERANAVGQVATRRRPRGLDLSARMETDGWIFVSQAAWRGWTARSAGRRLGLVRANGAFLAIRAPAGETAIALRFAPASMPLGAGITLLALAVSWLVATPRWPS